MEELWQPVPGFEGAYSVSNKGTVWNLRRDKEKIPGSTNGRPLVCLSVDKRKQHFKVHQLVALVFLGPCPANAIVCHRDDNKLNNCVENLYYGNRHQNAQDAIRNNRLVRGEANHKAKLSAKDVLKMRQIRKASGDSYEKIGKAFGVGKRAARLAISGESWTHI